MAVPAPAVRWRGRRAVGGGFSGSPGLLRLVNSVFVGQIGWLIPTALVGLASGLVLRGRAPRTDRRRAGFILWGLWFLVHAAVFSYMSGIIHSYYAVAMAPAMAALIGGGVAEMWAFRSRVRSGGILLGATLFISAFWAWYVLAGAGGALPLVGLAALVVATVAAAAVVIPGDRRGRVATAGAIVGLAAILVGPAIYTGATMTTAYGGGDPRAGIASADTSSGFGGGSGSVPGGGFGPGGTGGAPSAFGSASGGGLPAGGGAGDGSTADQALTDYLVGHAGSATWIVATASTQSGADIELATGDPVLAMGGFTGSDPAMTVERLQALVSEGKLRYVLVGRRWSRRRSGWRDRRSGRWLERRPRAGSRRTGRSSTTAARAGRSTTSRPRWRRPRLPDAPSSCAGRR